MLKQNQILSLLKFTFTSLGLAATLLSHAQVNYPDAPSSRNILLSDEQFGQVHFTMATQSATAFLSGEAKTDRNIGNQDAEKARYHVALSALWMNTETCVDEAEKFISERPNTAYGQRMSFALAQYHFLHDEQAEAIPFYEGASIKNLTNGEIADLKFELAYCYFNNKQFDKAAPLFSYIKELKDGKYYRAGNYYYGLLAYNDNRFKDALECFDRIAADKEYKAFVPYYVAEIYYFMGDKAKALEQSLAILKGKDKSYYEKEVYLLTAQCYFEDGKFGDAKPYFEFYFDHTEKIKKENLYKMAYCYYRVSDWQKAIEKFKLLSNNTDSLGQSSMYLLGDCYLKTGDRASARNAFGLCADMAFNEGQQEAAMMLYSRISFETGHNDDAVRELNTLLKTFLQSQYKDEANTLLSNLLLRTNHFAEALKHLEEVDKKENTYWQTFQKAAYGYGVQLFRKGELEKGIILISSSLQHPLDPGYECAAYFWKGELNYRMHKYAEAISSSQQFIDHPKGQADATILDPQATVQHAYLNMGFAAMELQNYSSAQNYFYKARQEDKSSDAYSSMIANLREADAVFMQQNYKKAITLYDNIISTDTANADYARYQKSIILGLQGRNNEKIVVLQTLIGRNPPSAYATTAHYEIAITCIENDKYALALPHLKFITDTSGDNSTIPKAWMKTGFVQQQLNDNDKAIIAYKHVVIDYPGSDERMAAIAALRSIFIQSNLPSLYAQLLHDNNLPSADSGSVDSAYYAAAESQYAASKWETARLAFENYLKEFPHGVFVIKAHYYKGECAYQLKKNDEALVDYKAVLATPWSDFSESSASNAAEIEMDAKDYAGAFDNFLALRRNATPPVSSQTLKKSFYGLAKSGFLGGKFEETVKYADSLLLVPGLSADMINEALYFKARSQQQTNKLDSAIETYRLLTGNKNGEVAAESRYRISEMFLQQEKLKEAEEEANETLQMSAGYDRWIIKTYILLSDIFFKQKDYFQAKATLQSIVKNTKDPELKKEATMKLDEVKKAEKEASKHKVE